MACSDIFTYKYKNKTYGNIFIFHALKSVHVYALSNNLQGRSITLNLLENKLNTKTINFPKLFT